MSATASRSVPPATAVAVSWFARLRRWPAQVVIAVVVLYQRVLSPALPRRCRFYPSCSSYALNAVRQHGVIRGGGLALRRLGRCHPWNPGGVDHVPPGRTAPSSASRS